MTPQLLVDKLGRKVNTENIRVTRSSQCTWKHFVTKFYDPVCNHSDLHSISERGLKRFLQFGHAHETSRLRVDLFNFFCNWNTFLGIAGAAFKKLEVHGAFTRRVGLVSLY